MTVMMMVSVEVKAVIWMVIAGIDGEFVGDVMVAVG